MMCYRMLFKPCIPDTPHKHNIDIYLYSHPGTYLFYLWKNNDVKYPKLSYLIMGLSFLQFLKSIYYFPLLFKFIEITRSWQNQTCFSYLSEWVKSLSHVWLFATPWTAAHQAPLSTGFSRQENWSGLPFPSPGDLFPTQGLNPGLPHCRQMLYHPSQRSQLFLKWKRSFEIRGLNVKTSLC